MWKQLLAFRPVPQREFLIHYCNKFLPPIFYLEIAGSRPISASVGQQTEVGLVERVENLSLRIVPNARELIEEYEERQANLPSKEQTQKTAETPGPTELQAKKSRKERATKKVSWSYGWHRALHISKLRRQPSLGQIFLHF